MILKYYYELNKLDLQIVNDANNDSNVKIILSWISSIIIGIGVLTNLVSLIAFLNPKTLSSTNVYLACLCTCDCVALIGLLINSVLYSKFTFYEYIIFNKKLKLLIFMVFYNYVSLKLNSSFF